MADVARADAVVGERRDEEAAGAGGGPPRQPATPTSHGWRDVAKPVPLVVGVVLSAAATVVQLISTYDGFFDEAIGSPAAWALIGMNVVLTVALMLLLAGIFKPRNVLLYALTVALSFQTIIATDLAVEPLAGTDQVGEGKKLNAGFLHTALEKLLTGKIDDPVEDAKRSEIAQMRAEYPAAADVKKLRTELDEILRTDGDTDDSERKAVLDQVDGIIADAALEPAVQVREITLTVYATIGRDPITDLLKN